MKSLLEENISALHQATALLPLLSAAQYSQRLPTCFNASVGGHIRHNIDHYLSFLAALESGRIDYEARQRDARLEADRDYAVDVLVQIINQLATLLRTAPEDAVVQVRMENTETGDAAEWGVSSRRRELQFLLSHTIHHYALVAVCCRLLGIQPHPDFGVAPATLRYRESLKSKAA